MEGPYRRQPREGRRSGFRWRSSRPRILNGGHDAPLSARGRFDYRLVLIGIVAVGVYAMVVVELTRH